MKLALLRVRVAFIRTVFLFAIACSAQQNAGSVLANPPPIPGAWSPSASLSLKESFDSNVFLQSVGTNANQQSFITTFTPAIGLGYKPSDAFNGTLTYAPEINFFHAQPGEDFTLHRVGLTLGGKLEKTCVELNENFVAIDGDNLSPSYFEPGGAPAGGGPQIRDRRDALVERGQFRLTEELGRWFIRPVVSGYLHDFQTVQKLSPGYQNFVDRNDLNGGLDAGYAVAGSTSVTLGYRYGVQNQAKLFSFPEQYDSTYHRVLFGLEGTPWTWLKLGVSLGPEFRYYADTVSPAFQDKNELYTFVDSTATITPMKGDTVTLSARRFEQPSFTGRSTYIDSTYEMTWRHKLTGKLTIGAGVRAYQTDFLQPALRNDWIVTGSALVAYAWTTHLSSEASYLYDDAFSRVPNTPGREYTRNLGAVGLRYSF